MQKIQAGKTFIALGTLSYWYSLNLPVYINRELVLP